MTPDKTTGRGRCDTAVDKYVVFEAKEYELVSEDTIERGKLFLLSHAWLGPVENSSSVSLLTAVLNELIGYGSMKVRFLLVDQACSSISEDHPLYSVWQKAIELGCKVYVSCEVDSSGSSGSGDKGFVSVSEAGIADLLMEFEVVTLG